MGYLHYLCNSEIFRHHPMIGGNKREMLYDKIYY